MIIREANIGKFGKLENQKYQFAPQNHGILRPIFTVP